MKKKILTTILVFLFAILLCGCSADVSYGIVYEMNDNGTYGIMQSMVVTVDKKSISDAGKTTEQYFNLFKTLGNSYIVRCKNVFNLKCDVERDEEIEHGKSQKVENLCGEGVTVAQLYNYVANHMKEVEYKSAGNEKYFSVAMYQYFDTTTAYSLFWQMIGDGDGTEEDDGEIFEDTFINKTVYTQYSVFHGLTQENYDNLDTITKLIVNSIEEFYNGEYDLNNKDLTYYYTLGTPQAHLYTDADDIEEYDSGMAYVWEFSSADLKKADGDQMEMWLVSYNRVNWYQLGLYITIIFGFVLIVIASFVDKKKSKEVKQKQDE